MKNIIIVIVDAFRPENISLFGYDKKNDKNIKKIAGESLLFRQFFSSSNATAPSLNSIFTGKYPNNHGIIHQFPYTKDEEIDKFEKNVLWLPSYLKEKGYSTFAIDWIGMWFKEGFEYYEERQEKGGNKFLNIPFIKKILLNLPNWAYKLGKKFVKSRASEKFAPPNETMNLAISKLKETQKPFFLFVHFWDTHFPFSTIKNPKLCGKNDIEETLNKIKDKSQREYFKKRVTDINLPSVQDMINKYDLAIQTIDYQIGRLYKFLKKNKLWDETVLIILGDHGTNLIDHNIYFSSSSLFDSTIHVPMIMHLPGINAKEINEFAQNVDILPTIFDYMKYATEEKIDGVSLMPLIEKNEIVRDKVFSFDGLSEDIKSVRTKNRKLIIAENSKCNLCKSNHHEKIEEYDLEKDPEEKNNIFNGESDLKKFLASEEKDL
jgi:arylsulfatase A-like enzyme